jgi:2-dehydro-3-deoxyphosphogluconate aldolase/(4S)-4-hydroxy-2-oxoglutarate aldolase
MSTKSNSFHRLVAGGVIPVIRAESAAQAMNIVDAVKAGGVESIEITMTVPGAIKVMEQVAEQYGDEVILGAGTILDAETARAAILAGAEFIVGPSLNLGVIEICHRYSKIVCPGALTPTEVVTAWEAGADIVKIFPCGEVGGPSYIKSLKGPLPHIQMMPTGGVDLTTAADFIKAGCIALGVGTALVDRKAVAAGNWDVLTENARKFIEIVKAARGER